MALHISGPLYVGGVEVVDEDGNIDAPVTTTNLTTTGNTILGDAVTDTLTVQGASSIQSTSALSLAVGANGATTPAFTVDSATASQVAGLKVTGAATGGTVAIVATDSGADTNLTINAKGTGTIGIGSVSTGVVQVTPKLSLGLNGGAASDSGILMGVGTSVAPAATSTADAKFVEIRAKTTAATGDNRLAYLRYDIGGAAGGECIRAFTDLTAATNTARGAHVSLQAGATGTVSGLGAGVDAQLYLKNEALAGGTYSALNSEIYSEGSSVTTAGATDVSFIRVSNGGDATGAATVLAAGNFMTLSGMGTATSATNIFHTTGTVSATHGLRINIDGVDYDVLLKASTYA